MVLKSDFVDSDPTATAHAQHHNDLAAALNASVGASGIPASTLTTKGDILVATAGSTVTRQGVGANGYTLQGDSSASAGVKWGAPGFLTGTAGSRPSAGSSLLGALYYATDTNYLWVCIGVSGSYYWAPLPGSNVLRVRQTSSQTIPDTTSTAVTFDTESYDRLGVFSPGGSTYTPGIPGLYEVSGGLGWLTNSSGYRQCSWFVNGSPVSGTATQIAPLSSGNTVQAARTAIVALGASDNVAMYATQTSGGGSLGTSVAGTYQSSMDVRYLGPA